MFSFETLLAIVGPLAAVIYLICAIGIWCFADSVFQAELPGTMSDAAREELMQLILMLRILALFGFIGAGIIVVCVYCSKRQTGLSKESPS